VLQPGSGIELPDLPAVPWADKTGSLANTIFGALPKAKAAAQAHVASTDASSHKGGVEPETTASTLPLAVKHWFPN
jgi:hypothetical protein